MTGRKENFSSNVELNLELKIIRLVQTKTNMTAAGGTFPPSAQNCKHKLTIPHPIPSYLAGKFGYYFYRAYIEIYAL
jgi:hypothetical protein